jgi:hypothetical protein
VGVPDVAQLARLLRERNAIDSRIAQLIGRPMTSGHLGEWVASTVFGVELERSASAAAIDGWFVGGPLDGRSVNVKWYLKREGLLDMTDSVELDYYLVLAGPASPAESSRGSERPWCIASVHLFDAQALLAAQRERGVKVGTASSVRAADWAATEVYPSPTSPSYPLGPDQVAMLDLLAPP